ncbi:MAG: methyltransferase [Alphaproteobacteria bacterium]
MSEKQAIFTLLNGRVSFYRGIYNPTSDAVWLAAFAPTKNISTVLDAGIGTGGVSLCLLSHNKELKITGIDISESMLSECKRNIELNNANIDLIQSDFLTWKTDKTFDLVITNPPYFKGTPAKHNAHHNIDLTQWTKRAIARVKPNGYFCTICDSLCVADVISAINNCCGTIKIIPLFGHKNTAERVLISGKLGTKTGSTLYSGFNMNTDAILRDGLTIEDILTTITTQ